ncbi:hypothetical protein [Agrobacterium radiobacter]|uniref:hypothetical protein n=1 Tax=Agrobacterium radiobacter TaxID=362 RepID=UPI003F8440C6
MSKTATLYDKTGAAFKLDHEHNGTLYVRPLVKVVMQSTNYHGDDFHEEVDFEPADYIVAKDEAELFYAPPIQAVEAELVAKQAELSKIQSEAAKALDAIRSEKQKAEWELSAAKRQLEDWMKTHKSMIDLGNLLDGKILYPLSVEEDSRRENTNIPDIPKMKDICGLRVESGDFEKGKEWRTKRYLSDHYHTLVQFFDTEEERTSVILSKFEAACGRFRSAPNFNTGSYSSAVDYGLLLRWVDKHTDLSIPDDIKEMKAAHDAALVEQRKAALAAELAAMSAAE